MKFDIVVTHTARYEVWDWVVQRHGALSKREGFANTKWGAKRAARREAANWKAELDNVPSPDRHIETIEL